jgi:hypothetical protein
MSAVTSISLFVIGSDKIGCWCDIIDPNILAQTEDKTGDRKESFYEELESVLKKLLNYHMNMLLGNFIAEVGTEDIFKPATENKILLNFEDLKFIIYISYCNDRFKN